MFKKFNLASILSIIIIGLFVGVVFVYADWTAPKLSPPNCETNPASPNYDPACDAPINTGSTGQKKTGDLVISGGLGVDGVLDVLSESFFSANLNVTGDITMSSYPNRIFFGSSGKSYLRLYDPSGPPLPPGVDTSIFKVVQNNSDEFVIDKDGNVGIGTTTPWAKLDVNGNVNVNGDVLMGYNIVSQIQAREYGTVNCPAGQRVIGGGCNYAGGGPGGGSCNGEVNRSYPNSQSSWYCNAGDDDCRAVVYAICARIQ